MGCICSKGTRANDYVAKKHNAKGKELTKKTSKRLGSFKRENGAAAVDDEADTRLINNQFADNDGVGSTTESSDEGENNKKKTGTKPGFQRQGTKGVGLVGGVVQHVVQQQPRMNRISSVSNGERGAQVVAGWPSWLTAVAGEAINGWVPRKADSFEKLDKIGQGTYSSVYRARDLENNKIVALKKVRFANMDPESVRFMAREIIILRRLDHPNVMKLEGIITSRVSGSLYLVFEYMEHDLSGLAATPEIKFSESQIKCYMQQLLLGLEHCHGRGVVHRDIKGSNLLIDQNGNLKIGDFGLATFFGTHQKQPMTSRVVTLWYRPPELLLGSTEYGGSVDLWSTGCILAELFAGKPIMPGRTEVEQLHKIFKLCGSPSEEYWKKSKLPHATIFKPQQPYKRVVSETFKEFPSSALALLDTLLSTEPEARGTTSSALQSKFFTTDPLPCDPSSLPKYPPSKEFDAKLRDEDAKRRKGSTHKARGQESFIRTSRESRAIPAPDANAELATSLQKRQKENNPKSCSEKYNPEEDGGSGFPMEPRRGVSRTVYPITLESSQNPTIGSDNRNHPPYLQPGASELSRFSNSVAVRGSSRLDCSSTDNRGNSHWPDGSSQHSMFRPNNISYKKEGQLIGKESKMEYFNKKNRIHYSGPLVPPGGNLDDMLKEHERQIQQAVRKARGDKTKNSKTNGGNGLTESLLHYGKKGR